MAKFNATTDRTTEELFALAEKTAKSAAEFRAIETERALEIIYQARWARRRLDVGSRSHSPALQQIAGWN